MTAAKIFSWWRRDVPRKQRTRRLIPDERGEKARLRSLRWRRAHGIGPRRPAERPWLALGISRSCRTISGTSRLDGAVTFDCKTDNA